MKNKRIMILTGSVLLTTALAIGAILPSVSSSVLASDTSSEGNILTYGNTDAPKNVFLFIGDGMTYPQIQVASDYLGSLNYADGETGENEELLGNEALNFMNFESIGTATTYDSTSFCPDSASTATAIATGEKTFSGVISMDETLTYEYETIAEQLKDQLGYEIGIVTSVNLNHATPAAFYAHEESRSNYYEIGLDLINSDFDYFAGGGFISETGDDQDLESLYSVATSNGYTVLDTKSEIENLSSDAEKVILIDENLDSSLAMQYEVDREEDELALKDYVEKGIEVLDNDNGFFMMVEGGKIDWAGHANDAGTVINEVLALADAIQVAIDFYNENPDDTLIIVTGDHETGGLSIGYAGTKYDTYLENLNNQQISFNEYTNNYVEKYLENDTSFDDALLDISDLFGLIIPDEYYTGELYEITLAQEDEDDDDDEDVNPLLLSYYEIESLRAAYDRTMENGTTDIDSDEIDDQTYLLYGSYDPLTVTITHILNQKSGIAFTTYSHTGLPVGVFAMGNGSEIFEGYYDNTDIYNKLATIFSIEA